MRSGWHWLAAGLVLSISIGAAEILPPGHRPAPPGVHALVGGRIVPGPGEIITNGVIVIRDGFIESVGPGAATPPDARVWEMKGLTVYAGLIDPYLTLGGTNAPVNTSGTEPFSGESLTAGGLGFFGVPGQERDPGGPGPGSDLAPVTPERRVADSYAADTRTLEGLRELGFTAGNAVPARGIVRGTSAFVMLGDANPNDAILKPEVFQHVAFDTDAGRTDAYPRSLMGVIAAVRQTFLDGRHYAEDHEHYRKSPAGRKRPGFNPALEALAPAVGKRMGVVFEPGSMLMVDRAARLAKELDLDLVLVSSGQEWRRPDLVAVVDAAYIVPVNFPAVSKLPEDDDWEQVSLDQLRAWDWAAENPALLRARGREIALTTFGLGDRKDFRKKLQQSLDRGLAESDALAALTTVPARLCGVEDRLGTIARGKIANLTVVEGESYFNPDSKVREVWIDGRVYRNAPGEARAEKKAEPKSPEGGDPQADKPKPPPPSDKPAEKPKESPARDDKPKKEAARDLLRKRLARPPMESRGPLAEPMSVLVQGATVWTCGPAGRLEQADLLVVGGKIRAVGKGLADSAPGSALRIDGKDKHVTPGLIDAHSHSMILGGVNEGTIPSSAMVRIGDVVNSETANIYKQLAGGLTVANLLHGSANPIGGQNAVIKLREGSAPEALKLEAAPPGIKFALGENVKQSNAGEQRTTRFPQTRMGVRTFMANRFTAGRQYLEEWAAFRRAGGRPPRRDLELETIGEILEGKRWIHCHSYRQDEILAFLRLMESFGVKVGTLQHVLEGYKVADEIAAHGAGASCFADWWAYKFEVYDAIPYAGSLMRERGVVVSFNSDSSDLARRLYLEAAKAVKYGGAPEEEALRFVTLNPARQLRIDQRVGSLEPGKDGDFVIWSRSPLDSATVCLETWIEGKKYFDRSLEAERVGKLDQERKELIEKAKKVLAGGGSSGSNAPDAKTFFEVALEHAYDHVDRHCED